MKREMISIKALVIGMILVIFTLEAFAHIAAYILLQNDFLLVTGFIVVTLLLGLSFLVQGIKGISRGKIGGIDPLQRFSFDYILRRGKYARVEREYTGFFGYTRSIIAIVIGLILIAVVIITVYSALIK